MKYHPKKNPRFVWLIGAIHEVYQDLPSPENKNPLYWDNNLHLYDRQEEMVVVTVHNPYAQAMCLELVPGGAPFTSLEEWFNTTSNKALASEGIPPTK